MTVDEERGIAGAAGLDPELLARRPAAQPRQRGGRDADGRLRGRRRHDRCGSTRRASRPDRRRALRVTVAGGGRGGHSGGDIALGRANAIKLPGARAARGARAADRLVRRRREPQRDPARRRRRSWSRARTRARAIAAEADGDRRRATRHRPRRADHAGAGRRTMRAATPGPRPASARILDLIAAMPVGPLGMSADFPGVVETSSSLGIAATDGGRRSRCTRSRAARTTPRCPRSRTRSPPSRGSRAPTLERRQPLPRLAARPGLRAARHRRARSTPSCSARAPHVTAHPRRPRERADRAPSGPGSDAISFGPQIEGPHAPGERLHIPSAGALHAAAARRCSTTLSR